MKNIFKIMTMFLWNSLTLIALMNNNKLIKKIVNLQKNKFNNKKIL